jgi:hypothetical protein
VAGFCDGKYSGPFNPQADKRAAIDNAMKIFRMKNLLKPVRVNISIAMMCLRLTGARQQVVVRISAQCFAALHMIRQDGFDPLPETR